MNGIGGCVPPRFSMPTLLFFIGDCASPLTRATICFAFMLLEKYENLAALVRNVGLMSQFLEYQPNHEEQSKQDCEQKAFHRLAARIKEAFPRLPIMLLLDGLYHRVGQGPCGPFPPLRTGLDSFPSHGSSTS